MQALVLGWFAAWCYCQGQVGEWQPVVSTVVGELIGHTWWQRQICSQLDGDWTDGRHGSRRCGFS